MRRSVVVSTLGITQTLAWGSTYYLTAVFADPISEAWQLPHVWFFGIFSAALLLSGLLGPLAGRMIDKHGGRDVLAATSLIFAAGLICLSFASGIGTLALAWALLGIGMGFGLYEAAFATAAGLYGQARNAITGITLFAGFASTFGWPASALFIEHFGWRGACVAWAILHLVIGLPMNRLLIPKTQPHAAEKTPEHEAPSGIPWTMIVLASVFGATWFVSTALAAHLPRLLEAMGAAPAMAIFAASLVGPAQVAARMVEFTFLRTDDDLRAWPRACIRPARHCWRSQSLRGRSLRAAAWRGQRHADDRTWHLAARALWPGRLWPPHRHSFGARAHSARRRAAAVRSRAHRGGPLMALPAFRHAHRPLLPGPLRSERVGAGPEGRSESWVARPASVAAILSSKLETWNHRKPPLPSRPYRWTRGSTSCAS